MTDKRPKELTPEARERAYLLNAAQNTKEYTALLAAQKAWYATPEYKAYHEASEPISS